MNDNHSLKNKWIVITRPEHQAKEFSKILQKGGGCAIHFPLIEIKPNIALPSVKQQLKQLPNYDLVVFISANAVEQGLKGVDSKQLASAKIATTGKKTAQALLEKGVKVDFCPKQLFNSEALLAIPEFQQFAKGKKIAIVRGEGGREQLREALLKTGASIDYIDVYKRECPQNSLKLLKDFWERGELDVVILTSGTSVCHFFKLAENEPWTNKLTLLLGSQRMQQKIPAQFRGKILIAEDPSDETLYKRLTTEYG